MVVCDQLVDLTSGRKDTFYDGPPVTHVSFADPYCPTLRPIAIDALHVTRRRNPRSHGTVVVISGPRFSTRAESKWFQGQGWEVINMTQYPECYLARELEMCYVNISLITDYDVGLEGIAPVSVEAVVEVFNRTTNASNPRSARSSERLTSTRIARATTRSKERGSRMRRHALDLGMYVRAVPLLFRHLSILAVMPLLAAVVDVLWSSSPRCSPTAAGGLGSGPIHAARSARLSLGVRRGDHPSEQHLARPARFVRRSVGRVAREVRRNTLAAIGFQFVVWAAIVRGLVPRSVAGARARRGCRLVPHLHHSGGRHRRNARSLAISASIRGVRANVAASLILALVFFAVWYLLVPIGLPYLLQRVYAASNGSSSWPRCAPIVLAYLAFPFAKQYDDVAFTRFW